jgi:hypothetical protein
MTHIAYREFDVMDGATVISSGEIRYQFTITKGRKAVTWANASEGFSPAEDPTVDVQEVAIRLHKDHPWRVLDNAAFDAFSADVPDEWFLSQLEAAA